MAQVSLSPQIPARPRTADQQESRVRMVAAWLISLGGILGMLGGSWDIQWHAAVGPDSFFTPSHGLLYLSRALMGLVALYMVFTTTRKYHQGTPGVTAATTTPWLKVLRAPVGFVVTGLGVLSFILGGLYDLWWHTLYGFDVTLLSPSHFALGFGSTVANLGLLYIFASEANRQDARGEGARRLGFGWPALGLAFAAAGLVMELAVFTQPALHEVIFAGGLLVYPIAISLIIPLGLFTAASFLRRPGSATLVSLIFTVLRTISLYWAPFLVEVERQLDGLPYKVHAFKPAVVALTEPAYLLVVAVAVDLLLHLARRFGWSTRLAVALAAAVATAINFVLDPRWITWLHLTGPRAIDGTAAQVLARMHAAALPSLAVALVVAVPAAWFAWGVGNVLRHTDK